MKTNNNEVPEDLLSESEKLVNISKCKEPWDPNEARREDPEHEFMRSLLYDAKRWKESGHPEFEKRVLVVLRDFLHDHIQVLSDQLELFAPGRAATLIDGNTLR